MRKLEEKSGFTLIEVLIVVILLGVIATIVVPQVSVGTEDAKLNTLKTNLDRLRKAVDLYYCQHDDTYPGKKKWDGGIDSQNPVQAATSFIRQLTEYTDSTGDAAKEKDTTHIYGPYFKRGSLPENPFNDLNTLTCDIAEMDITAKASDGTTGWKFYVNTGVLMANDGGHDGY